MDVLRATATAAAVTEGEPVSGAAVADRSPVMSSLEKIPEGQKLSRYVSISHRPEKGWDQAPPHSGEADDGMEWSSPRQHPGVGKWALEPLTSSPRVSQQSDPTAYLLSQGCLLESGPTDT